MMNISTLSHKLIDDVIQNDFICVDGTAGNGFDTLYLVKKCKMVYAFDIQEQAKENTLKKLTDYNNYQFILDSHANIDSYVKEPIDLCIFNFGYLPHGNESITTQGPSSVTALEKCFDLLKNNGYMVLCIYIGHPGGYEEFEMINNWINSKSNIKVESYQNPEKNNAPILKFIQKTI